MQAVQITQHGGPEVLQLADVPRPEPGPGEVLVRVLAVSVNHLDLWVRRGMPGFPVEFPRIPGCDGTGEVAALGAGVNDLSVGQQVLLEPGFTTSLDSDFVRLGQDNLAPDYGIRGEHCDGFAAEYVTLPVRYCLPLPAGLDPITTAATPLTFLTAWGMLMERAVIRKGETVMVLGAGSGVGCAAIQIAKDEGCRVFTSASSPEGRALGLELGAEAAVDHTDPNWPKEIKALTGGKGTDVVVEHVGPATWFHACPRAARSLGYLRGHHRSRGSVATAAPIHQAADRARFHHGAPQCFAPDSCKALRRGLSAGDRSHLAPGRSAPSPSVAGGSSRAR